MLLIQICTLLHNQGDPSAILERALHLMKLLRFKEVVFIRSGSIFRQNMTSMFTLTLPQTQIDPHGTTALMENSF